MAEINFSGLASGIDTESIISKLMLIERQPLVKLEQKSSWYSAKKTALQDINTKLLTFYNASRTLLSSLEDVWNQKKVSVTDTSLLGVTATADAGAGTYEIEIIKLAKAQTIASSQQSDSATALNFSGTFEINGKSVSVVSTDSLQSIRNKINNTSGISVTASIVDNVLRIKSSQTGTSNAITTISDLPAQQHEVASDAVADPAAALGYTGTFEINGQAVNVIATDSLNDIRDNINAAGAGVTAAVNGSNQLVMTSDTFGWAGTINSSDTIGTVLQNLGVLNPDTTYKNVITEPRDAVLKNLGVLDAGGSIASELVAAQDAEFEIDGQTVIRSTNIIDDVLTGVTLTLKAETTSPLTMTISPDNDSIISEIKEWVDAYNAAYKLIKEKLTEATVSNPKTESERNMGLLRNDMQLMRIRLEMRGLLANPVESQPADTQILSQIGIEADTEGQLTINEDELLNALEADPEKVRDLFVAGYGETYDEGTAGFATRIQNYLNNITKSYSGEFALRAETIDDQIEKLAERIEKWEERLTETENKFKKQFREMERIMQFMQAQSSWLAALQQTLFKPSSSKSQGLFSLLGS